MKQEQTKIDDIKDKDKSYGAGTSVTVSDIANFEEAISATEFGKFNFILVLISIPSGFAHICETTTMSYVLPIAQCDLNLSLDDKGLLNAVTYLGMMSSGLIWGFLCDTFGRKKALYIGNFLDAFLVISSSLSQSFAFLAITKFFGGFIFAGPFAALAAYLSECHSAKYRSRIQMVIGIIFSCATIALPLIAGIILPLDIRFNILNYLDIHSWNIYLLLTATFPIIAGCCFIFVPESPKFLMTIGKNDQALEVFKVIYSWNTGKPKNTYPISRLVMEKEMRISEMDLKDRKERIKQFWLFELITIRSLFVPPLLKNMFLVCGLQMSLVLSLNTIRLWIPTIFQVITDYEYHHSGQSTNLCTMLEVFQPKKVEVSEECTVNTNNSEVYVNSIIIATVCLCGYIAAGSLINFLGHKTLLVILGITGGLSSFCFYFSTTKTITITLMSINTSAGSIGVNVVVSVVVILFPTNLRTMAVQLAMLIGRFGAMGGNIVFPFLLKTGCVAAFGTVGTVFLKNANFEQAISATGFGKFNIILTLISLPVAFAHICETTSMSYVLPIAQCDLNLTLEDRGVLNGITYLGMVSGGLMWGFISDTFGRKLTICIGTFMDSFLVICCSMSQSARFLKAIKFFSGFIFVGPVAALTAYLSEVHSVKYRSRMLLVLGILLSCATIALPLLAGVFLPLDIDFTIFNYLDVHSWNIYLLSTATFPITGACCFFFVPESPKFLMTIGKNEKALEVFQKIYSWNKGKPRDTYPISSLIIEKEMRISELDITNRKERIKEFLRYEMITLRSLFIPPLLKNTILVCGLEMTIVLSLTTIRLWIPTILQVITDYQQHHNGQSTYLCTMLEVFQPKKSNSTGACAVNKNNSEVYIDAVIIAIICSSGYFVAGSLIKILGHKKLLIGLAAIGSTSCYLFYFSTTRTFTIILMAMDLTVSSIGVSVILSAVVVLFPTKLRTMAVQLSMLSGRSGGMIGNVIFPFLLKIGCIAAFGTVGTVFLSSTILTSLLPNVDKLTFQ